MRFSVFLLLFVSSLNTYAATQGSLGSTSEGSLNLSISLTDSVSLTEVDDAIFGEWDGSSDLEHNDDICVYSNAAGGTYNVTITGDGPGFIASNANSEQLNYDVLWNDVAGTNTNGINVTSGQALASQTGASIIDPTCNAGSSLTARMRIRFLSSNLLAANDGNYTSTVQILIAPE